MLETRRDADVPRDRGRLPPEVTDRDYAADEPTLSASQAGVSEYLRAAYKHRWLALAMLVLVTLPILAWTWMQKPVYEATVRLVLDPEPQNPLPFREPGQEQPSPEVGRTQQQVLRSRQLAARTVNAMKLWEHPEFGGGPPAPSITSRIKGWFGSEPAPVSPAAATPPAATRKAPAASKEPANPGAAGTGTSPVPKVEPPVLDPRAEALAGAFASRVRVSAVYLTRVVNVSFEAQDPELAARAANTLADEFITVDLESRFDQAQQGTQWLEAQLAEQRKKVEQSEQALQRYKEQQDALSVGNPQNIVSQRLSDLSSAVTRARTDRLTREAGYRQVEAAQAEGTLESVPVIAANPAVQQLRAQLGELQRQRAELEQRYGERHPEMIKIQVALDQTRQRLQAEVAKAVDVVRNEYQAALANERSLAGALEAQKGDSLRLNKQDLEYGRLQRDAQSNRQIYDTLLQQARELGITSELKRSAVRVLDRAEVPDVPIRPDKPKNALLALAMGLFAAIGVVFGREYMDPRLKTPDDVQRHLRLPFIGLIPMADATQNGGAPLFGAVEHPAFSEALRRVRTNLELLSPQGVVKILLVTSTGPQEGKTTISVGVARALAAAGHRTLLVDADMRRPKVHRLLGLVRKPGLAEFLSSKADVIAIARRTDADNLVVIPAGARTNSSTELLSTPHFGMLLTTMERRFDWIVIDSPPVLSASEAALLARFATGVLFVVGAEMPPKGAAQKAVEQLVVARARFAGAVLNRAAVDRHGYYYSPYYSKKYESYYAKDDDEDRGRGLLGR